MTNEPQVIQPGYIKRWLPQIAVLIWRAPVSFMSLFLFAFLIAQIDSFFVLALSGFFFRYLVLEIFCAADTVKITPQIYLTALINSVKSFYFHMKLEPIMTFLVVILLFVFNHFFPKKETQNVIENLNNIFYWSSLFLTQSYFRQYIYPLYLNSQSPLRPLEKMCTKAYDINKNYCRYMEGMGSFILLAIIFIFASYISSFIFLIYIGFKYMAYREIFFGQTKNKVPQTMKSVQLAKN